MRAAPTFSAVSRRVALLGALACLTAPVRADAAPTIPVVTLFGDSITAGYGLASADALPSRLGAALLRHGAPATVRGAGVSGDTTGAGLARLDFSVQSDTRLCVVALGGNDLLQGVDPAVTRANLTAIVKRLRARGIGVILVGLTAPRAIGAGYARDFNAVFPEVSKALGVPLYPNLLVGVTGRAALLQRDGVHPNAAGVEVIAERLAPLVAQRLARKSRGKVS